MKTVGIASVLLAAMAASGCSGLQIASISKDDAGKAHQGAGHSGYIVYHPRVLVRVGAEKRCPADKMPDGKCDPKNASLDYCEVSPPFYLPDYDKPYRVDVKTGIGKAGVDVAIANGWMLSSFKDNSDNSVLLGELIKAGVFTKTVAPEVPNQAASKCPAGVYQWTDRGFKLVDLVIDPR